MGGVSRPDHAGDALVHLDSGGCLPGAILALRLAHAPRLGDLVLRLRGGGLGGRGELGVVPPRVPLRRLRRRARSRRGRRAAGTHLAEASSPVGRR